MSVDASWLDDLDLDRKCFSLSSAMADIFAWTYGMLGCRLVAPIDPNKFDNATSKAKEIGIRALIVIGAIAGLFFAGTYLLLTAVVLGAGSKLLRGAAFYFQKNGFTHIRGQAPEQTIAQGEATVMTWNLRGRGGGLHYAEGVIHWRSRIDRITDSIKAENPDVIVLQEIYDPALTEALFSRLESKYAHFYTHLGADLWGGKSGCMVITKCAVHSFTHTDFNQTDSQGKRGFETIEIKASPNDLLPCARIIGTQLSPGKQAGEIRIEQVEEIVNQLAVEKEVMPTLFVGNMNIDRDSQDGGAYLSKYLYHSYRDHEPTHSDELANQWAPIYEGQEESSDFISFFKRNPTDDLRVFPVKERGIRLLDSHLVRAFDENYNTKTALSDHHAIVTTFSGLK